MAAITDRLTLTRTVGPDTEPISLAEAKSQLRVDIDDDDAFITGLIAEARETIEDMARRALITQTWRLSFDYWPACDEIEIPRPPLQSVSGITYRDSDGNSNTLDSGAYEVDIDSEPGRVKLAYGQSWPTATLARTNPLQITFVAGYGDDAADVPGKYKRAMLLLIGHWYEFREAIVATGAIPKEVPLAVQSLVMLDRNW